MPDMQSEQSSRGPDGASRSRYPCAAVLSLLLGIGALIPLFGLVFGFVALILGIIALTQERAGRHHAIAGIALGILGPVTGVIVMPGLWMNGFARTYDGHRQAACQANLNSVGKSIALYTTMSYDKFPRLWDSGAPNASLDSIGASSPWKVQSRNGMNNVWLLIDQGMISVSAFRCPSDERWRERATYAPAGWTDTREFSYGIHWPYEFTADGRTPNPAFPGYRNISGNLALMTDRNPGGAVTANRPPSNHTYHGEAVLYRNCSVRFHKSTSDSNAGIGGDDIYVNDAGTPGGLPQSATDTSITPAGP